MLGVVNLYTNTGSTVQANVQTRKANDSLIEKDEAAKALLDHVIKKP